MTLARLSDYWYPRRHRAQVWALSMCSASSTPRLSPRLLMSQTPVVLQISQNAVRYHGALAPIGLATLTLAARDALKDEAERLLRLLYRPLTTA
jgi:fructose-bisphosphate aldolase class II